MNNVPGAYINVANQAAIGITSSDKLVYRPSEGDSYPLGEPTKENINSIIYALEQIKSLCVK